MAADHERATGERATAAEIAARADRAAQETLARHADRFARSLAVVVDVLDPHVIVLGGGLSNVAELYAQLPGAVRAYVFSDTWEARIVPARWGDSSGVRGAARLWAR